MKPHIRVMHGAGSDWTGDRAVKHWAWVNWDEGRRRLGGGASARRMVSTYAVQRQRSVTSASELLDIATNEGRL